MDRVLQHRARSWPAQSRDDMIADAHAALWAAWHSLIRRGKYPVGVGVSGIADRCCRFVRSGRKIGNQNRGRGCPDVLDHRVRRRFGIAIVSLDEPSGVVSDGRFGVWREWLTQRNVATPAQQACFRVDFGRWLAEQPDRKRRIAELLVEGHENASWPASSGSLPAR
jgi:hypothetical protein